MVIDGFRKVSFMPMMSIWYSFMNSLSSINFGRSQSSDVNVAAFYHYFIFHFGICFYFNSSLTIDVFLIYFFCNILTISSLVMSTPRCLFELAMHDSRHIVPIVSGLTSLLIMLMPILEITLIAREQMFAVEIWLELASINWALRAMFWTFSDLILASMVDIATSILLSFSLESLLYF